MNCDIFRKRLADLLDDNISCDLKEAMLNHIKECRSCSELYQEEIEIDKAFINALDNSNVEFRRMRADIMKDIDKSRYGKGILKRIKYHLKTYKLAYAPFAAILAVTILIAPRFFNNKNMAISGVQPKMDIAQNKRSKDVSLYNTTESEKNASRIESVVDTKDLKQPSLKREIYTPKFEVKGLDAKVQPNFNSPWEASKTNNLRATIEGRGLEAIEEGIGKIYIENLKFKSKTSLELIDNESQQTPKSLKWIDDNFLVVIIGDAFGTVTKGGEIYLLDINTGRTCNADVDGKIDYGTSHKEEAMQIISANENSIEVLINIYEDDNSIKFHTETRVLNLPFLALKNYLTEEK